MASSEYADLQKFRSKDGRPLVSLRSHPCADMEERYILWSDVQHEFQGIDHLEVRNPILDKYMAKRTLFTIDSDGELWQPLRIKHRPDKTYVVIYGDNQRQQTEESCNTLQGSDERGKGVSQSLAYGEIRPSLKDLFEICKYLYRLVRTATSNAKVPFRQAIANTRYHHLMFVHEIERLDKVGISTLVDGKSHEQMLEELRDLEQQALEWEYQETCRRTLCDKRNAWSYATSSIFLALPSDPDCWDDSNTSTHQFRLYFMCDNWKQVSGWKDMPQHVHLSNHPGYPLQRQQEFFQKYGNYVLRMLLMAKHGHVNENYEIPPLDTLKILWGCHPDVIGSHINKDTLRLLIDKAINYLQELSPPKWTTKLGLDRDQSAAIRTFFDVQDDHNSEGNLYRYITSSQHVYWMCQAHVLQHSDNEFLGELRHFVQSRGGRVDMQQARLDVELGSSTEAEWFRRNLKWSSHTFDISVKLTWNATRPCVEGLIVDITNTGTVVLELDGITLDTDSQGYDRFLHSIFNNHASVPKMPNFVTLLNYPQRHKQSIFLARCLLQSVDFSGPSLHSWAKLQDDLIKFRGMVAAEDPSDWSSMATVLQSTLELHGVAGTNTVIMYSDGWSDGLSAVFDLKIGAVVKVHFQDTVCPKGVLSMGTISTLGVHVDSLWFDEDFFYKVSTNALLQELNVSYLGHNVLYYTGHISKMWHTSACSCRFTLLDRVKGTRNRVVAQLAIGGSEIQSSCISVLNVDGCDIHAPISQQVSDAPVNVVLEQWDCDHVFSALSDYSSSFLDMATKQHPLALTMFTLDVSQLSQVGVSSIQEVLGRSSLEQLHVVCTPVDSLSKSIAQVLGSIQWDTIKSLILSGDEIDAWCQIWPSYVSPWLLSLQIQGSSSSLQDLSHLSVLFLQQVIFSSPLMKLRLRNLQLQDKRDWALLIDSIDISLLQTLELDEHSATQLLSVPDAVDPFGSRLDATHSEAEGRKLVLPSFTLDTTTLSQPDLARVRVILRHCILEKLVVQCHRIDLNMSSHVAKVLESVQWPSLEFLLLSGNDINQWIQLLIKIDMPCLKILQIWGTKSVLQELSHKSILFIERLIGTSSFIRLHFRNVLLRDPRDWVLLVNTMDLSMLETLDPRDCSYEQLMSSQDAVNLHRSKITEWQKKQLLELRLRELNTYLR